MACHLLDRLAHVPSDGRTANKMTREDPRVYLPSPRAPGWAGCRGWARTIACSISLRPPRARVNAPNGGRPGAEPLRRVLVSRYANSVPVHAILGHVRSSPRTGSHSGATPGSRDLDPQP